MLAYRIYGPLDMQLEEISTPNIEENEVLIKILAAGICMTDIELYDGSMPYIEQGLTKLPMIPGHEWSGKIVEAGSKVKNLAVGDIVVGDISIGCGQCLNCLKGIYHLCDDRAEIGVINHDGSFAEYLCSPAKNVYKVPEGISPNEAALIEPAATALNAVKRVGIEPGEAVIVFGDGPIGLLCGQMANIWGASKVVIVSIKSDYRQLVENQNMVLIDSSKQNLHSEITAVLDDKADVVIEVTGNPSAFAEAILAVKPGGRICAGSITGSPAFPVDMDYITTRDITVFGVLASPNAFVPTLKLMSAGKLDVNPLITKIFPFDRTVDAFEYVRLNQESRIKVLVVNPG